MIGHFYRNCKTREGYKRLYDAASNQLAANVPYKKQKIVRRVESDDIHEEKYSVYNVNESDDLI